VGGEDGRAAGRSEGGRHEYACETAQLPPPPPSLVWPVRAPGPHGTARTQCRLRPRCALVAVSERRARRGQASQLDRSLTFDDIAGVDEAKAQVDLPVLLH
jgi:hypothetical protein